MQKFKKLSSLLLVFALLFNFFLPVNAANTEGVTYTASVDQSTLNVSSEAQTVVMTVRADEKVVLDSLGADVIVPEGWTITAIENEELEFLATDFDCGNAVIAYATADAENKTTDLLAVITFQVPANAAAGTYEVGLRGLNMSRDYGSILWEDGEGPDVKTTVTVKDKAEAPEITYNATVSPETLTASDEAQTVVMTVKASEKVVLDSLGADIIVPEGWTITAIENEELVFLATDYDCGNAVIAYATADAENKTTDLLAVVTFQVPANVAAGTYEVGLRGLNMSRDYGSILWEDGEGPDITATVTVEEKPAAAEVTYNATVSPETLTSSDEAQTVVMTVKASEKVVLDSLGADIIVPEGWTITAIENEELDFLATDYDCGNAVIAYATADAENKTTDLLAVITFQVPANVAAGTYEVGLRGLNMSRDYGSILWEDGEGPDITATITVKGAPEHICQNNLTAVPAKGATCTEPGNIAYYICSCGKYYEDAAASKEIKAEDVVIPATGHSYTETVTKEPTCTEKGEKTFTCSRCGHSYTEEISAKGHTYDSVVTAPTCTEKGYTTHTCSCGDSYVDSYVDALGHDMGQWETTKEATCTEKGAKERKCSRCDHTETEEIDALGHDYESVVTAPTCTEKGYTTHTCSRCGDSYVDSYVDALGHDMGQWETTKEATCTEKGVKERKCSRCDHTETEEIDALGHDYESVVTAPTCTEKGYTTHTCSRCGDSYVDTYVDALGHTWDAGVVTVEPTEETEGEMLYTCTVCHATRTEVIPALDHEHNYEAVVTAPTCTEKGYTTHTCSCGDSYVDSYVDALGHDMGQWETTKEATCTEKGVKERKCSRCDHTETEEIDALGHDYESVVTAPTCTEKGYTTHTCSRCGDSYVDTYVDALGHTWDAGVVTVEPTEETEGEMLYTCTVCHATRTEVIPALDHEHNYEAVVTAPTCTEKGYTTHTCSCGDSYVDSYVDALGHDMGQWETTKEATCTEKGVKERKCSRCDHTETEEIAALGHDHKAVVTAPTCTEKGYTTHTCSRCGDSYVDSYVDALGHDMGQWETTKEATCTEKGIKERKCSHCDHTETEEIAALGHEYTAVVTEPTCEDQGYTTYTCSRCGDSYVSDYTDPVDHVYEDGHCKWCGKGEEYAKFTTISTSLGGNIAMNFYMELSEDLVSDPDAYIQFTFAGRTVKVPLSQGVVSGNTYRFSCPITSKNMTDEITAQVYNENGPVGNSKTMDVATYCNWVIDNYTDAKTVNLMKAMLNYGASAQMLFNYRTDDLANAALSDADKVLGKVDASAYVHSRTGEEEGIKPDNYTLLLDSETTVRVYFKLTGDKTIDEYTFTVDGVEVTPVYKNGLYYIQKTDIGAHRLDELHVFTCGDITITYGGLSYVNQVMTYYTEGTTFDMASALFAYSKAAEAYIG